MSAVRFLFPENRLGKLVNAPGGLLRRDAVAGAAANLEEMREDCLKDIDAALAEVDAALAGQEAPLDPDAFQHAYGAVCGMIGLVGGASGLEDVAAAGRSLCDLLDRLHVSARWNAAAIKVHLDTLHLLRRSADLPEGMAAAALTALRAMTLKIAGTGVPEGVSTNS